ncbi:AAA family ATPase [Patescibacteria group bacterium]|nr:AAA family ATPase [Patescibacteria group bacterium]MBU4367946.1 AAA family ATPase [Patescibacteria group bacterium]MBU4461451.1 AAA family ATPase [Patescibacteria group bacterium]MCG2700367.1 AAA family ATPase [Candidatus Parcubacteria bacterium]MCG2809448.1 AAA family ATPase [Candidatus Portnoybacteria bacterium]
MFIKKITIKNFRLFPSEKNFEIDNINRPDGTNEGSGLNVFVGENGSGKTALLDAFALPILEYKTEKFGIENFNDTSRKVEINIYSEVEFEVDGTMPKGSFKAKGFSFEAGVRSKESKTYLSSIVVNDQKFIKVDPDKPKDNSPDLRVNVNNPFKGKRFNENDVLFLDRNRLFQTRSGNFNTTRFDRLMEDFSYQYIKKATIENLNEDLDNKIKKDKVENNFLSQAIKKFQEISGSQIKLDFLDNYEPFKNAFLAARKDNNQQISLSNLGSGYEMIFALLYSFYLAQQSEKELIVLIDEPELHLHPRLQEKFVEFLLEFSKKAQIILASHSPLLVKQLSFNENVKISVIENDGQEVSEIEKRVLPYISANETNFLAFNLATEEYHNELFEELKFINGDDKSIKDFDNDFFVTAKGEPKNSSWKGNQNEVSEHTFIRNQIHHQKENGKTEYSVLKASIEKMRSFF